MSLSHIVLVLLYVLKFSSLLHLFSVKVIFIHLTVLERIEDKNGESMIPGGNGNFPNNTNNEFSTKLKHVKILSCYLPTKKRLRMVFLI